MLHPETVNGAVGKGRPKDSFAENANLSADRFTKATADAIGRRKEIYEVIHPETKAGTSQAAGMNKALGRGDVGAENAPTFTKAADARLINFDCF